LKKCHDKVKTAVKQHFHVIKKETKKSLKSCACRDKATNYCSASATSNAIIEKCVTVYVKSCATQCLKRSSHIVQRNQDLALHLCKRSSSAKCVQVITEHAGKGLTKVHKHLVKVHILKKVGATKKQVHHAIENKKIVIVDKLLQREEQSKLELEREELLKKLHKQEKIHKKLEIKLLKEEQVTNEIESELKKEEEDNREFNSKLHQEEQLKHDQIKQQIHHHSKKCACESATTAEEKKKCVASCKSRKELLNQLVTDHVDETSSSCSVKASLACTAEDEDCQKNFILHCVEEDQKRKNELVTLLENCDSFSVDDYNVVYQP